MDAWFEEDEEVFTHPRDPYTRVDILPTSRRVRVELDGVVLAESTNARVLYEAGLPPRWYIPKTDLRMGAARAERHSHALPLQGPGPVLVRPPG